MGIYRLLERFNLQRDDGKLCRRATYAWSMLDWSRNFDGNRITIYQSPAGNLNLIAVLRGAALVRVFDRWGALSTSFHRTSSTIWKKYANVSQSKQFRYDRYNVGYGATYLFIYFYEHRSECFRIGEIFAKLARAYDVPSRCGSFDRGEFRSRRPTSVERSFRRAVFF